MKLHQKAISLIVKTKIGNKIVSSQRYRIILSAAVAFAFNLLYAIYHCVLGVLNISFWFITMCAFYGILATIRFSAVLCERNHYKLPSDDTDLFVMKFTGILLVILGIVLATINYVSLSQNIATKHEEIIMITIATYTFYKITMAIVKAVKQHKNPSPLLKTIRSIGYAEVSASILTLQRSMLVSFGSMDSRQMRFLNAMTGAVVCVFILILGLSMIVKSRRKEQEIWQNQNL
ncbi:MAG TPA: hypothetical protein H9733_06350 [Candidatus Anaerotignum merdipullorum]|nr:hypothetical protein [Candidatus Anaerotignum merdipullorum]